MDEKFMMHAISLAVKGKGHVNPNPLVGAVIVKDGRIIGEGYHTKYGCLHAEREAFRSLENQEDAAGADMYVTLEPCCHYGHQPPCTLAIIEHGIKNVYVGSSDPNPLVSGKGIKELEKAGIHVETGICRKECDEINKVFFHYIQNKTPYVIMKFAESLDGKTACFTGDSRWITGEEARLHVQETRNELKGIMVGIGTVLADDPRLTCRLEGGRNPVRIICDSSLMIPEKSNIIKTAADIPSVIACSEKKLEEPEIKEKALRLEDSGAEVLPVPSEKRDGKEILDLVTLMKELGKREIDGVLLEGGATLAARALEAGIVKHIQAYIAPVIIGGKNAPGAVAGRGAAVPDDGIRLKNRKVSFFGEDMLLEYDVI